MPGSKKKKHSPLQPEPSGLSGVPPDEDELVAPVISVKQMSNMRKANIVEAAISEAGSDEEEVLDVDGPPPDALDDGEGEPPGAGIKQQDYYSVLKADTPLRRLRRKEAAAKKATDAWARVKLCQEVLGLARLYAPGAVYGDVSDAPMLLPNAHFQLARAYADSGCMQQASDHCHAAIRTTPVDEMPSEQAAEWQQEVYIMLAEMLLAGKPPNPRLALHHLCTASNAESPTDIKDQSVRVLASQCLSLMGSAKSDDAHASQNAIVALKQRSELLEVKLADKPRKSAEADRLQARLTAARRELGEEESFKKSLAEQAHKLLDDSSELLMGVIAEEEDRMRDKVDDYKQHPLIQTLWRQACELLFKLALVEGLLGNTKQQLTTLKEISSADASYGCVPPGLRARALKEQGASLVASSVKCEDRESRDAVLYEALEVYNELLEMQGRRFKEGDHRRREMARAQALKLLGNVQIALRRYARAQECFQQALDVFAAYRGPDDLLVADLEHRMQEVEAYLRDADDDAEAAPEAGKQDADIQEEFPEGDDDAQPEQKREADEVDDKQAEEKREEEPLEVEDVDV